MPFRLEYFNNADEHALKLEMKGCQDLTTYEDFAPLRLTEFKLPADTDVNATNPPDRQCKTCKAGQKPSGGEGCYPATAAGNASIGVEPADKSVFEAGRSSCLAAGKSLWCDQVALATQVGDGKCDPMNNVAGCWDGGDCCAKSNKGSVNTKYCKVRRVHEVLSILTAIFVGIIKRHICGLQACACLDPENKGDSNCKGFCKFPNYKGDGNCDDENK